MCALRSFTCRPHVAIGHKPLFESSDDTEPGLCRECTEEIDRLLELSYVGYGSKVCVRIYGDAELVILPFSCRGLCMGLFVGLGDTTWAKSHVLW